MESFSEIFQAVVHDQGKRPRNYRNLENPTHQADGVNPLTGDQLRVQFQINGSGLVEDVAFTGKASALATASASIMTSVLRGISKEEALAKISATLSRFGGDQPVPGDPPEDEYAVLLEIRNFPQRIRCASLAWNTAAKALAVD